MKTRIVAVSLLVLRSAFLRSKFLPATFGPSALEAQIVPPTMPTERTRDGSARNTDAADSAATARAEFRLARESLTKGDTNEALTRLVAAARAFPVQSSNANSLVALAGKAQGAGFAATALRMANDIGLAVPASADTSAWTGRKWPDVALLLATQHALRTPLNNRLVFRTLADSLSPRRCELRCAQRYGIREQSASPQHRFCVSQWRCPVAHEAGDAKCWWHLRNRGRHDA